jgi:hypothetical protein
MLNSIVPRDSIVALHLSEPTVLEPSHDLRLVMTDSVFGCEPISDETLHTTTTDQDYRAESPLGQIAGESPGILAELVPFGLPLGSISCTMH